MTGRRSTSRKQGARSKVGSNITTAVVAVERALRRMRRRSSKHRAIEVLFEGVNDEH
jgi:hypothetical protein